MVANKEKVGDRQWAAALKDYITRVKELQDILWEIFCFRIEKRDRVFRLILEPKVKIQSEIHICRMQAVGNG